MLFLRSQCWDWHSVTSLFVTGCYSSAWPNANCLIQSQRVPSQGKGVRIECTGIECILSRYVNDTKLCGDMLEGRDAIQRGTDRLEKWAGANTMKFKTKFKVLHLGQGNPKHKYRLGKEWIKRNPEKYLVISNESLNITQQCSLAVQKANSV
ncbi:rna-directed dna polymerase from mobile element jockey-like [Willisornis vidua]|uniref:Rna-directed dna polymerase from mobile element jockey-like n=1 Tax=Willisornis vidua TaxID=1566151 RepID=A0ABQ9DZM1_9PASS|nr:rna-directed dna polymerase from mobile element jockey-like [Willisornis vidua]